MLVRRLYELHVDGTAEGLPDGAAERMLAGEWPEPTWEWYRPSVAETRRLKRREPNTAEHVRKGGLLLRRIEA
jgi:hypothetical protein